MNQTHHERMLDLADKVKADRNVNGGVVVFFNNKIQGWQNELRDPDRWRPGCVAFDECGNLFESRGGNAAQGAEEWRPIDHDRLDKLVEIWENRQAREQGGKKGILFYNSKLDRMDIRFCDSTYGGLHCGEVFDVYFEDFWAEVRIEYDLPNKQWYLVVGSRDAREVFLEGLNARIL